MLQPGDLVRFKYAFSPKLEGNYSVKRYIEVAGWPESRTEIIVNGISDIPRLVIYIMYTIIIHMKGEFQIIYNSVRIEINNSRKPPLHYKSK